MIERCHFYSIHDMSIPFNLDRADDVIKKYKNGWRPENVDDVIELYNIWIFVENKIYRKDWAEDTLQLIRCDFKSENVQYFKALDKNTWAVVYKKIKYSYRHFFWEIIDKFNIDGLIDLDSIQDAFTENPYELADLLHQERLVNKYHKIITILLKNNQYTAEWLLQEFVENNDSDSHSHMFFPKDLSLDDREEIISRYLESNEPNLNYVRLVLLAKKDKNLRLSDKVRLKASRVEKILNDEVLKTGVVFHYGYGVCISDESDKPIKWIERDDRNHYVLYYSKHIIRKFPLEELPHYIRYAFEFLTQNGLISFIFKISESEVMERVMGMQGKYSYQTNNAFRIYEGITILQIEALQKVLSEEGKSIEVSLKAFYQNYLKSKYGYPSGELLLAENTDDWITKCRAIAPEIDAIARRYDLYAKTGAVDEELLQISSDNVRITDAQSINTIRYYALINEVPEELTRLFYCFFSDQSMLTYVEPFKNNGYRCFYQLLMDQDGKISYSNYHDYQKHNIDYLIREGYLSRNENDTLFVSKRIEIDLLYLLYEYRCCPAGIYGQKTQQIIKEMVDKGWLLPDNHLLSEEERNYFDYYLYSKYTNGRALRNHYVHGSNASAANQQIHREAYHRLLILLILELLKIEDDLVIRKKNSK